jgi:hypothetical protein
MEYSQSLAGFIDESLSESHMEFIQHCMEQEVQRADALLMHPYALEPIPPFVDDAQQPLS